MLRSITFTALLAVLAHIRTGAPQDLFVDVGAQALPGVVTTCGSPAKEWIVEVNGGGVVLEDFDGDGDVDLVLVDGSTLERIGRGEAGLPPRLFLNDGAGGFAPAGESWAMGGGRWGMGGTSGDVNGDGWPDLLVTQWGPDRLFLNHGGEGFVEVQDSGLVGEAWGTSAAFLDYDGDGNLDLALINYLAFDPAEIAPASSGLARWKGHAVMAGPEGLSAQHDQLYRGRGDGTFEEVSARAGFRPRAAGYGLGVVTIDYDADGDTDLYVANDSTPNHLWENLGDGTFTEVGFERGVAYDANGKEQAGMGIACGDWNGDGREDLFVTNFSGEANALYASWWRGRGFRERSSRAGFGGASLPDLGWGATMADLDLDGDLDLAVLNGHVYPQADRPGTDTRYAQPDRWYAGTPRGRFSARSLHAGPDRVSRAGAAADLDGDGDLDLVVLSVEGPVRVLRSLATRGQDRHWLRVRLRRTGGNRAGIGARVSAEWEGGRAVGEVRTSGGFQSGVPAEVHFGLGAVARLERLIVHWPGGEVQILEDVEVDRVLVVHAPSSEGASDGVEDGDGEDGGR